MNHRKSGRHLSRTSAHRKVMFRNMSVSLLKNGFIKTTLPKAKELRRVVEPLITQSKTDNIASRRLVFNHLRDKAIVTKLFKKVAPFYLNRAGGYLRILKCGFRPGDNAPMAYVELIDHVKLQEKQEAAS